VPVIDQSPAKTQSHMTKYGRLIDEAAGRAVLPIKAAWVYAGKMGVDGKGPLNMSVVLRKMWLPFDIGQRYTGGPCARAWSDDHAKLSPSDNLGNRLCFIWIKSGMQHDE